MANIHIRRLGDDVVHDLKRRAAANDRSLEAEVRHILRRVVQDDGDDMAAKRAAFRARIERIRREFAGRTRSSSVTLIREDRKGGHRDS